MALTRGAGAVSPEKIQFGTSKVVIVSSGGEAQFHIGGTQYAVLDTSGNLGLGETTPARKIDIVGSSAATDFGMRITNNSNGDTVVGFAVATQEWALGIDNSDSDKFKLSADADDLSTNTILTALVSGNIGINNTNPLVPLEVGDGSGASDDTVLRVTGGNTGFSTLDFGDSDAGDIGSIQYGHTNNALIFTANSAESFRIDSNQRMLSNISGSAALPYYSWSVDPDTGIYRPTGGSMGFSSNGALVFRVSGAGAASVDGNVGTPGYFFISDSDCGMYRKANNSVSISTAGAECVNFSAAQTNVNSGSAGVPGLAFIGDTDTGIFRSEPNFLSLSTGGVERLKVNSLGEVVITSNALRVQNGLVGAPGIAFDADFDTGIYRKAVNSLSITAGAAECVNFSTAQTKINLGSSGVPGLAFIGDGNTGIFSVGANSVSVSAGAVECVNFSAAQTNVNSGSAGVPGLAFIGDPDTGIFSPGANSLSLSTGGVEALRISTATIQNILPITVIAGSAAACSIRMGGDADTGMFEAATGEIGFASNGGERFRTANSYVQSFVRHRIADGSVGLPALAFSSDTDTGMYKFGVNTIGFSAGGVLKVRITPNFLVSGVPISAPFGSAAAPTYAFDNDTDTGAFRPAANEYAISCGVTEAVRWDLNGVFLMGRTSALGLAGTPVDENSIELDAGYINLFRDNTNTEKQIIFGKNGSEVGSIETTSTTTAYNTTSDENLKTDFTPLVGCIDLVKQMEPVNYTWKSNGKLDSGFGARAMFGVYPPAVSKGEGENGIWSMDYGRITPVLAGALKDVIAEKEELQEKVDSLEERISKVDSLEERISKLETLLN